MNINNGIEDVQLIENDIRNRISYIHDMSNNYMTIMEDAAVYEEDFRIKMLQKNNISGMLEFSIRNLNGRTCFMYEISSKLAMYTYYDKRRMNYNELKGFIIALAKTIDSAKEFLLDVDNIILLPETIYCTVEKLEYNFCYNPSYKGGFKNSLKEIFQYILGILEHDDKEAVVLAYGLQRISMNENYTFEDMLELIYAPEETAKGNSNINNAHKVIEEPIAIKQSVMLNTVSRQEEMKFTPYKVICQIGVYILVGVMSMIFVVYLSMAGESLESFKSTVIISAAVTIVLLIEKNRITKLLKANKFSKFVNTKTILPLPLDQEEYEEDARYDLFKQYSEQDLSEERIYKTDENYYGNTVFLGYRDNETAKKLVSINQIGCPDIEIMEFPFVIGKISKNVDYVLNNPLVSRIHAKLTREEEDYYIEDLNSTNGTCINDERIEPCSKKSIRAGDKISLGMLEFVFQ